MNRTLTAEDKAKISADVKAFLAEELEVDVAEIKDDTNIVDDLGGDSILFLEMLDEFSGKYDIDLEVRIIGQYMMKNRISSVGETFQAIFDIIERGDEIAAELSAGDGAVEEGG